MRAEPTDDQIENTVGHWDAHRRRTHRVNLRGLRCLPTTAKALEICFIVFKMAHET